MAQFCFTTQYIFVPSLSANIFTFEAFAEMHLYVISRMLQRVAVVAKLHGHYGRDLCSQCLLLKKKLTSCTDALVDVI